MPYSTLTGEQGDYLLEVPTVEVKDDTLTVKISKDGYNPTQEDIQLEEGSLEYVKDFSCVPIPTYTITVQSNVPELATTVFPTVAVAGQEIRISVDYTEQWQYSRCEIIQGNITVDEDNLTFIMPAEDVVIKVVYEFREYTVKGSIRPYDNDGVVHGRVVLGDESTEITEPDGYFVFYNVSYGNHILKVFADDVVFANYSTVLVVEGDTTIPEIALKYNPISAHGKVTGYNDNPVEGAKVEIVGTPFFGLTDAKGEYVVRTDAEVETRKITFRASKENYNAKERDFNRSDNSEVSVPTINMSGDYIHISPRLISNSIIPFDVETFAFSFTEAYREDLTTENGWVLEDSTDVGDYPNTQDATVKVFENNGKYICVIDHELGRPLAIDSFKEIFKDKSTLTYLSLGNLMSGRISDFRNAFDGTNISLGSANNLNTVSAEYMMDMFSYCTWDDGNVVDLTLNTTNVTNLDYMFYGNSTISAFWLKFNTQNVVSFEAMFEECTSANTIDISTFDFVDEPYVTNMFELVPDTCTVYVKDATAKAYLEDPANDARGSSNCKIVVKQ